MNTLPVIRWVQIWRDNAPLRSAVSMTQYLQDPKGAILAVLFPPEPAEADQDPELAPDLAAGWLPLLPAQIRAAMAADRAIPRGPAPRPRGSILIQRTAGTGTRPIVMRDGRLIEPLTHHAHAHRARRPRPAVRQEV
jgi:hypothetical protein